MTGDKGIIQKYHLLLGSKSPRRKYLLQEAGFSFTELPVIETEESFPETMDHNDVPVYLAKMKAEAYKKYIKPGTILVTADTIVSLENEILGKPSGYNEARELLLKLSGKCHRVISGVCLTSVDKQVVFNSITDVWFKKLTSEETDYYLSAYKPFDKAGAYGIQEWIGYIGVERIEGSFYNVMGLPVQKLYTEICEF